MTIQFHAQPYDTSANGFYFDSLEDYQEKFAASRVEEFEIQTIDGDCDLELQLAQILKLSQSDLPQWYDLEGHEIKEYICKAEIGITLANLDGRDEVTLYQADSLTDLAEMFVDEGLFGEIPDALINYIDYDAIARDLRHEYSEITMGGETHFYTVN
jgi:antirestriction protein